ncbi:MAG TPA: hypothetical protein VHZ24_17145 [Pirellulales bacterium]|nr:hypothetical protein [Pirellulales bacterium]
MKTESFDRDPGWEGRHNRVVLEHVPTVTQDFGYSPTQLASSTPGEIGGRVTRSTRPAYYASAIKPTTLNDKFSASGDFAITRAGASAGVFFGWFNSRQPGGSGRPIGSLGLHMDFEHKGARLAVRLLTGLNQGCGTFVTPFIPGKFRTTPLKTDGTRYRWSIAYDPAGAGGNGQFTVTLTSDNHPLEPIDPSLPEQLQQEARTHFPSTTKFTVDLPAGYKQQTTEFDRFGLMNMMKAGGTATIFFGDLTLDGRKLDLSRDPDWAASGNHDTYEDREQTGAHQFGFSPKTNFAGGKPGEIGGDFWRSGDFGYYADRVGTLSMPQRLEARGRVTMLVGGPDADIFIGWFNSSCGERSPAETGDFLGIAVGGPTRIGHMFAPALTTSHGQRGRAEKAPILRPGTSYEWSLVYDAAANNNHGAIAVTLGDETVTLALRPGQQTDGATFDRFGMFTSQAGGQMVRIYLDDLSYTAAR